MFKNSEPVRYSLANGINQNIPCALGCIQVAGVFTCAVMWSAFGKVYRTLFFFLNPEADITNSTKIWNVLALLVL